MDILILVITVAVVLAGFNRRQQRARMALLGQHLRHYPIERLMEAVTEGALQALSEPDPQRAEDRWERIHHQEEVLATQFGRLAAEMNKVYLAHTQVSRWPIAIAGIDRLLPQTCFDFRALLQIHADGIARAVAQPRDLANTEQLRDRAYRLAAELFLMQHSCHWFCKSKAVASARMLARHQTPHAQLVAAVSPETRRAYLALVQGIS